MQHPSEMFTASVGRELWLRAAKEKWQSGDVKAAQVWNGKAYVYVIGLRVLVVTQIGPQIVFVGDLLSY
jgi:hypothetical protein